MSKRREIAAAVAAPSSSPSCPLCDAPIVRSHRCHAPSPAAPPPPEFRQWVDNARQGLDLDDDPGGPHPPLQGCDELPLPIDVPDPSPTKDLPDD